MNNTKLSSVHAAADRKQSKKGRREREERWNVTARVHRRVKGQALFDSYTATCPENPGVLT